MSKEWSRLSEVHLNGEAAKVMLRTAKRGNVLDPCIKSGGVSKIDHNRRETCIDHEKQLKKVNVMVHNVTTINFA